MANMTGVQAAPPVPATLSRFARLPWRRIIQVLLAIGIGLFVAIGSFRTLQSNTYDASTWKSFIILGVAQGGIYALIALGYTLVYGVLRMINFAHGEVFMFGAFGSYFFATAYASVIASSSSMRRASGSSSRWNSVSVTTSSTGTILV